MISYTILKEAGADKQDLAWFSLYFDETSTFTVDEFLNIVKIKKLVMNYYDVRWMMTAIPALQTKEMVDLYLGCYPPYDDMSFAIMDLPICQTQEMIDLYISWEPDSVDKSELLYLTKEEPFAKTLDLKALLGL